MLYFLSSLNECTYYWLGKAPFTLFVYLTYQKLNSSQIVTYDKRNSEPIAFKIITFFLRYLTLGKYNPTTSLVVVVNNTVFNLLPLHVSTIIIIVRLV